MENKTEGALLRVLSALLVSGVLLFLAASGLWSLLREGDSVSYYENRQLASPPQLSREGVLSGGSFRELDTWLREHTAGRNTILRAGTLFHWKVLRRPVVNEVVLGEEVLLPWQDFWTYSREDLRGPAEAMADRLAEHARCAEEQGGRFLYVAVPAQAQAFGEAYPAYLQSHLDFYTDAAGLLFEALEARGVAALDMREVFLEKGILEETASRVDNHYSIEGAYETYRCLMERLASDRGEAPEYLREGEFRIEYLPNHYLGSRSRKLFDLWPGEERLGILIPEEEIPLRRRDTAPWLAKPRESDTVYELPESPEETVSYSLYMGGDWASTVLETGRPGLPRVLLYGDSFTNPLECILWRDCDVLYSFDFRDYGEKTLDELIRELSPDVVICVRDYEALLKTEGNGQ